MWRDLGAIRRKLLEGKSFTISEPLEIGAGMERLIKSSRRPIHHNRAPG